MSSPIPGHLDAGFAASQALKKLAYHVPPTKGKVLLLIFGSPEPLRVGKPTGNFLSSMLNCLARGCTEGQPDSPGLTARALLPPKATEQIGLETRADRMFEGLRFA